MNLVDLVRELERQKRNRLDLIVESTTLKAVPDEGDGIRLEIPEYGEFPLTEWAHGQLADKLEIPRRYYERMRNSGKSELLAENVNAWLGERERRLIRILDGRIRAILSDRYRMMDNYDLIFLALDEFKKKETVEIYRIDLTETMLYLKAVDRTLAESIREGDVVHGGIIIRNSEVGASALRIEPFILRRVCGNGLILQQSLKKIHLGRETLEIGEINWSHETRELEDRAIWAKIRDIIRATFDKQIFQSWVKKLRESTQVKIEKPIEAVENIVGHLNLSEEQKQRLLMHFSEPTKYGLINAVANLAGELKDVEEQVKLEEFAGEMLEGE
ncbi:DUF932 domain-containing protein [Candidatus Methanodesulfokora washburnensis]|jgi:hypothetical protein|uniref:DUF932 domain-containing protein n=1 Tax=Candidatus Methanodesulfokora washburnensis TaxID=2478471 RepID=A0A429GQY1_9CREN|nr:DUF932 domain-containing protein [Candidatus Methanodesulfokores washburnensis]RSN76255.1 DUF932 domain-containing protein [Candidatus Methanodesulfokores washburnensis]